MQNRERRSRIVMQDLNDFIRVNGRKKFKTFCPCGKDKGYRHKGNNSECYSCHNKKAAIASHNSRHKRQKICIDCGLSFVTIKETKIICCKCSSSRRFKTSYLTVGKDRTCRICGVVIKYNGKRPIYYCSDNCRRINRNNIAYRWKNKNPQNKMISALRSHVNRAIKRHLVNKSKSPKTKDLLGCELDFFCKYMESKFSVGMTWDNYGEWHIDHIRPISSFDISDPVQLKQACNYKNLQPLWAIDNIKKGAKYE